MIGDKHNHTPIDWGTISAEYIAGGTSYRKLAQKYHITLSAIYERAKAEGWIKSREQAADRARTETIRKTAEKQSDNAVKLEEARADAIEVIRANLERLKSLQGSRVTTRQLDSKGQPITVEFNLMDMVAAMERLQRMTGGEYAEEPIQVIIDV